MPDKSKSQQRLMRAEVAYLAGIFDGEGTVGIYENGARGWQFQVMITNCDIGLLWWINERISGTISEKTRSKKEWRRGFTWRVTGDRAADFLKLVQPYSVIKRDQISLALEFRKITDRPRRIRQTDKEFAERRLMANNLKLMKRGKFNALPI